MKVAAFSIKPFEKSYLAKANIKNHDISLIPDQLNIETAKYAKGSEAVIIFTNDNASENVIEILAGYGIKYIATRSVGTDHINKNAAKKKGIQIANVPNYSPEAIAEHTVALALSLSRCLILSNRNFQHFDFRLDQLVGFNFFGKTVGLIGFGHIGHAVANIFNGLGCKVLVYDLDINEDIKGIYPVTLDEIYANADIISLHLPLTAVSKFMINATSIAKMKKGVMLINTSRGGLIKTNEVVAALKSGQIGYLGMDVYEFEKELFFEDHSTDPEKDGLLKELISLPNVLITPHQAFLTVEALQQIFDQTIKNIDTWEESE